MRGVADGGFSLGKAWLRFLWTGSPRARECAHRNGINDVQPSSDVCEECIATSDLWIALRMCATCGYVACCDTSKNTHAKKHAEETGHPIVLSSPYNPKWAWCYPDRALL